METKTKKTIAALFAAAICPECTSKLLFYRTDNSFFFECSAVPTCPNYGKTFKVPTIELEEIAHP